MGKIEKQQSEAADALTNIILETFRVNGRLIASGDRLTRKFGQSSSKWQVLGAIADGPKTVVRIADYMGLTRQSVQRTADLLVGNGLCQFQDNPYHQRSKLLHLSEKGKRILESITFEQIKWSNSLARTFSKGELDRMLSTLHKFRKLLESTE